MLVKEMFEVGEILEWEDKAKSIKILDGDDCEIVSKVPNRQKMILHLKRLGDDSEGNVFVRLKDEYLDQVVFFKKLMASKEIIGMTLNEFKNSDAEKL